MFFHTFKETKDTGICLPCIGQAVYQQFFFLAFHLCSSHRKNVEGKTYPAMDSPVYRKLMVQISSQ